MRLRIVAGSALALLFLLLLAVKAPAHLLGYVLDEDQVRLSGFSGTVWDGSASSAALATDQGWLQLGQLHWSLSELYMLLLSPTADIRAQWGQQQLAANVQLKPSGDIRVVGLDTRFSAALVKRWMPVNLRGELNLFMDRLILSDGMPISGSGRLVWRQAFWRGNLGSQPLGDYVLQFDITAPMQGSATVSTLSGPLKVEGGLTVNGRQYAVDARLSSRERLDQELANALALLAAPVDGGYLLKFNSEF